MEQQKQYCAMIADIKDSKKMDISRRREVQERIQEELRELNRTFQNDLAVPLDFSGGDRVQALFHEPMAAYALVYYMREILFPIRCRVGLGIGDWSVRIEGGGTNAQDGTAYHRAIAAFERAHATDEGIVFFSGERIDAIINILIKNEGSIFEGQTDTQKKIVRMHIPRYTYRATIEKDPFGIDAVFMEKGLRQKDIAKLTETSEQNVSKQMKRGRVNEQQELRAAVEILMRQHFGGDKPC